MCLIGSATRLDMKLHFCVAIIHLPLLPLEKCSVPSDAVYVSSIHRHFMLYTQDLIQSETIRSCIQAASCYKPVFRSSDIHTQF
jgi:hypothetical protein